MPKLIVDSSVAVKWFVPEIYSAEARRVLDNYEAGVLSATYPPDAKIFIKSSEGRRL